jgi:hypothetical protein
MKKNVKLTPAQNTRIDTLMKSAKFTRLTNGLLADKTLSADEKSKIILKLKY